MDIEDIIFSYINEEAEFDAVLDYLDEMPKTDDSVKELLSAIQSFDIYELYEKLLVDFRSMLNEDEIKMISSNCKLKFILPVPGEDEEA